MNYDNEAIQLINQLQKALRVMVEHMGSCSKGTNAILFYLHGIHDGATSGELKEHFHIGSGGIANALKDLEEKGYIVRKNGENDKRVVSVYITDSGRALAKKSYEDMKDNLKLLLETIGEEDSKALFRILEKAIELNENDSFTY